MGRAPWLWSSPPWSPAPGPSAPQAAPLLYSGSLRLWVFSFLLISCFLDLTMAELLSVSLLKKAGGWPVLPGDLEPILLRGPDAQVRSLGTEAAASGDGALATSVA